MTSYVLRKIGLLKNKKFLRAACLAGVEIDIFTREYSPQTIHRLRRFTIMTNQPIDLKRWVRAFFERPRKAN